MKTLREIYEGKKDYEIYHKQYTDAMNEVKRFIEKNGLEIEDSVWEDNVVHGTQRKPSEGKTVQHNLELMKDGKSSRRRVHVQVYGMKTKYELNMYIS